MNQIKSKLGLAAAALLLSAGLALAQTPPPPGASSTPTTTTKAPAQSTTGKKKASTPEGIECSAQADAKNLHGKERKTFRSKCIADLKKKGGVKKQ